MAGAGSSSVPRATIPAFKRRSPPAVLPSSVLGVSEGEFSRLTRVWGRRCMPLLYDSFLLLGELRGLCGVR